MKKLFTDTPSSELNLWPFVTAPLARPVLDSHKPGWVYWIEPLPPGSETGSEEAPHG